MGLGLCLESGFGDRLSTTPAWVALWRIAAVLTLQIPSKLSCMHAMSFAGPHTGLSLCMLTLVPHNRHNMGAETQPTGPRQMAAHKWYVFCQGLQRRLPEKQRYCW